MRYGARGYYADPFFFFFCKLVRDMFHKIIAKVDCDDNIAFLFLKMLLKEFAHDFEMKELHVIDHHMFCNIFYHIRCKIRYHWIENTLHIFPEGGLNLSEMLLFVGDHVLINFGLNLLFRFFLFLHW